MISDKGDICYEDLQKKMLQNYKKPLLSSAKKVATPRLMFR